MEEALFSFISRYMILTDQEKQALTDLALFRNVKKGSILLREGDVSTEYYFVVKGCLRTYYVIEGEEKTTEFYTEGQSLAPSGITHKTPSAYFISCVEDSVISAATPDMEQAIFEKFPRFESLCRVVSEELLAKNQVSFDHFKNSTPEQRYLGLLNTRPDLLQRVPLYQLANYIGVTPESLSRIRKRLTPKA